MAWHLFIQSYEQPRKGLEFGVQNRQDLKNSVPAGLWTTKRILLVLVLEAQRKNRSQFRILVDKEDKKVVRVKMQIYRHFYQIIKLLFISSENIQLILLKED